MVLLVAVAECDAVGGWVRSGVGAFVALVQDGEVPDEFGDGGACGDHGVQCSAQ